MKVATIVDYCHRHRVQKETFSVHILSNCYRPYDHGSLTKFVLLCECAPSKLSERERINGTFLFSFASFWPICSA